MYSPCDKMDIHHFINVMNHIRQAEYIFMLSKALYCKPEALLEVDFPDSAGSRLQAYYSRKIGVE